MSDYKAEFLRWKEYADLDAEVRKAVEAMQNDENEIKMWFSSDIAFGTAGLRGVMTAGTNAMNVYTVGRATQGLANLINDEKAADRGVVIAYDCRNNSELFAKVSAEVLAANGVKTYIFESLRPTPVLSFALRELNCIAGINITATPASITVTRHTGKTVLSLELSRQKQLLNIWEKPTFLLTSRELISNQLLMKAKSR